MHLLCSPTMMVRLTVCSSFFGFEWQKPDASCSFCPNLDSITHFFTDGKNSWFSWKSWAKWCDNMTNFYNSKTISFSFKIPRVRLSEKYKQCYLFLEIECGIIKASYWDVIDSTVMVLSLVGHWWDFCLHKCGARMGFLLTQMWGTDGILVYTHVGTDGILAYTYMGHWWDFGLHTYGALMGFWPTHIWGSVHSAAYLQS